VWVDFVTVADALGAAERGEALARRLADRIADVSERTLRIRPRPRVAAIEWTEPLMAAGNWMPELVALAGGKNVFGETGRHSPWLAWEALRAADPDVIVVLPCGFDLARTRREMAPLAAQPGFGELRAAREGRVFLADGSQYFNRPGPRLVESLEILAEMLHPGEFPAVHRGSGWEPWA
jgi:iron complex transport system substrate-binding protein